MSNIAVSNERAWAIVTGASSGIGEEFARQLAAKGKNVIVVARRKERLEALKQKLEGQYRVQVGIIVADLGALGAGKKVAQEAIAFGPIQGLVNNAGMGHYGPFTEFSAEEQLQMVDLNVRVLVELTHHISKHMLSHGKSSWIINVASVAAFQAIENFAVYSASKAFVRFFSETLYREFMDTNIHVSCLSPGGTHSEFLEKSGQALNKGTNGVMMSAQEVVAMGLKGVEDLSPQVVPGAVNCFISAVPRVLPFQWSLALFSKVMQMSVQRVKKT